MYIYIYIGKDDPKNEETPGRSPKESKDPPPQDGPKSTQEIHKAPEMHPRITKGAPRDAKTLSKTSQSQPKAFKRPPQGTLGTTFGNLGRTKGAGAQKHSKQECFLSFLLEHFRDQVHMQSAHAYEIQTREMIISSRCVFESLFKKTPILQETSRGEHAGPNTEEEGTRRR